MAISLQKGQKISLEKEAPGMTKVRVGLGWDAGENFDLDASVFLTKEDGKIGVDSNFVYYNNLKDVSGAVVHSGDNLTGDGDGDDEVVTIDLTSVPADVVKMTFVTAIFDAKNRNQNFGQVQNAFIRLVDDSKDVEVAKFDLSEDYSTSTAVVLGEIYRHNDEWKFNSMGTGLDKEIGDILKDYQ